MNLALFDLDNTLIAGDSDYEWGLFIVEHGLDDRGEYEDRNAAFHDNEMQLESGDRLFFFTDGLLESANKDKVEFGDDKLKEILSQNAGTALPATVDRVFASLNEFHGSDVFEDDVAVLGMEIV